MMKKLARTLIGIVLAFMAFALTAITASAGYQYVDTSDRYANYYRDYYDYDDDYDDYYDYYDDCCECRVYYQADFESMTATITDYYPDLYGKVVIPETIKSWDDDGNQVTLTVTAISGDINCGGDENDDPVKNIEIPSTVTSIGEHSVGYKVTYGVDEDGWINYDYVNYEKINDFIIMCYDGSYAQSFAVENGFTATVIKFISSLKATLGAASYTYTGSRIEPSINITDGTKKLVKGTDFAIKCINNINAGTATATIYGIGNYRGSSSIKFKINPAPATSVKVSDIDTVRYYDGDPQYQWPYVGFKNQELWQDDDYTITYRNNVNPGTAYMDIVFKGNFTGKLTISFKITIAAVSDLKASNDSASIVYLDWYSSYGADRYFVYRYDNSQKKYVYIGKTTSSYYYDENVKQLSTYKYKVVPIKTVSGKKVYGVASYCTAKTVLKSPGVTITTLKDSIKIKWKANKKADGYVIYRYRVDTGGKTKKVKTLNTNEGGSYKDKNIKKKGIYVYYIRSYRLVNGKKKYGEYGTSGSSADYEAILRGADLKKSRTSFKVYNKQGKKTTSYTYKLSENDIKILKNFAKKHFSKDMSRTDKLMYTLSWINRNVTYARGKNWNKISGKSWVEAVFKKKLGQCAQYNGAMASMMAYLGYDAYVIQGYRGYWPDNYWQHFWCEVKIQGRVYLMETGNAGSSGGWSYFLTPYAYTTKYIINRKPAETL